MKKMILLISLLILSIGAVWAQTKVVSGTVISAEDNQPIIGATVRAKSNAKYGRLTDLNGKFKFEVPANETSLLVTYVGMLDAEVKVGTNLKVKLKPDQMQLDEVVVLGYSSGTKRSFTGSAVTVKAEALEKKNISNVSQALAGEVPGVNVVNYSGQPGTSSDVYVRGVGSVNASRTPLYVVDGVPYSGDISSINPNDIESTTLLKDAAATSIYGSRGANGVIVINTKKGRGGKMAISADIKYGVNTQWIDRHDVIDSANEYLEVSWDALKMQALTSSKGLASNEEEANAFAMTNLFSENGINPKYNYFVANEVSEIIDSTTGKVKPNLKTRYIPELWKDEAFQNSNRTEANIQIRGGSDKIRAFTSLGYLYDKGISKFSDFKRFSGRINLDMNPLRWLDTRTNLSYSHSLSNAAGQSSYSSTNLFTFIDYMPPIYPVYERDAEGNKIPDPYYKGQYKFDYGEGRGYSGISNGLATAVYDTDVTRRNSLMFNANATIKFTNYLKFENTFSGSYVNSFYNSRGNMWYGDPGNQHGTIYHIHTNVYSWNLLSLLRFDKHIGKHSIDAFLAHEANSYQASRDRISKKNLADPFVDDLSNAIENSGQPDGRTERVRLESYFAQANYNYGNKYYLSATFRRDGSSRFLKNKWGNFGSIGAAWVLTSENYMRDQKWLPYFKLKASYGTLGQQSGINLYSGLNQYAIQPLSGKVSLLFDTKGNPELTWERSGMLQLGFEAQLWDIFDLDVDFYNKVTSSLLYDRRVAPSNGYAIYKVNDGLLQNKGLDIDLTAHVLKGKDYFFDVKLNAGFLSNKLLKMPIDPSTGKPKFINVTGSYAHKEGHSVYDYYMREYVGVNSDTGVSQWKMYYYDANKDGKFNPDKATNSEEKVIANLEQFKNDNKDKVALVKEGITEDYQDATLFYVNKSALPTVRGAFSFIAGFKGLELSTQFIYSIGGYGYDGVYAGLMSNEKIGGNNWHKDIHKRWMKKGQKTDIPRINNSVDENVNSESTRFLTSNSFVNFANFRIAYTLPKKWAEKIYMNTAKVWISGDNLALWSARRGFNPSTALTGSSSYYRYSPLTTITAGLRVNF